MMTARETPDIDPTPRSRRALLVGGLGALGAATAAAIGRPIATQAASAVGLGVVNTATTTTEVRDTSASTTAVALRGRLTHATGSAGSAGVMGVDAGTGGTGVLGVARSGAGARGVYGQATAGRGVHGSATTGVGVLGTGTSGRGVRGSSAGNDGVYGNNTSAQSGSGVHGVSPRYGVLGESISGGEGVRGENPAGMGVHGLGIHGVWGNGDTTGVTGYGGPAGVFGFGQDYGVIGSANNKAGVSGSGPAGVYGSTVHIGGNGVYGQALAANGFGIHGYMGPNAALAGYFAGDIFVTGLINGAAARLRLDHPDAPAERWYQQALVSSFEQVSVIGGNAVTGTDGTVTVQVPRLFARHHRDVRYVLTPVGAAAVPYVARKVDPRGRFTIAADRPGLEVSWQLTGVRTDPAATKSPLRVDVAKSRRHRGRYAQPALYGQPRSKALEDRPRATRGHKGRRGTGRRPATG